MQVEDDDGLEVLDLILKFENGKTVANTVVKLTNSLTYVLLSTYNYRTNLSNIPHSTELRLTPIYDTDDKFHSGTKKYENYFIVRGYNSYIANKRLEGI